MLPRFNTFLESERSLGSQGFMTVCMFLHLPKKTLQPHGGHSWFTVGTLNEP